MWKPTLVILLLGAGRAVAAPAASAVPVASPGVAARLEPLAAGKPGARLVFEQAGDGPGFAWVEAPLKASPAEPRAVVCPFAVKTASALPALSCALVQEDGAVWLARDRVRIPGAGWARARFPLPRFVREGAPAAKGEMPTPGRARRVRIGFAWSGPARGELLVGEAAWTAEVNRPAVPLTLGRGTGGEGAWSASGAPHSPTSLAIEETAGPEGTPAAVISFRFSQSVYNYHWATVAADHLDTGGTAALRLTYRTETPPGFPPMNVSVRENTGATWWVPEGLPLSPGRFRTATVPLARFSVPGWSADANGRLDEDRIEAVGLGFATGSSGQGRILVSDAVLLPLGW